MEVRQLETATVGERRNDGEMTAMETSLLDLPDHIIVENVLAELIATLLSGVEPNPKDLRDLFSAASTCKRIHALSSHPSLWHRVNAMTFHGRFVDALRCGVAPPLLPLGAVHCDVFHLGASIVDEATVSFMELFRGLTDVRIFSLVGVIRDRIARVVSSLPRLSRLDVRDGELVRAFAGVKLSSPALNSLRVNGNSADIADFLSANSFPSLATLNVTTSYGLIDCDFAAVAVRSCQALVDLFINGTVSGGDASPTGVVVAPPLSCPNIRDLVIISSNRVYGRFLSMFPNIVRLELHDGPKETEEDLRAIGGMMNLERLRFNGRGFVNESCQQLIPLVEHPMASGRRSLKSLSLRYFSGDLSNFLSSPWCSQLEELSFWSCVVNDFSFERLAAVHGSTLSSTLRSLTVQFTEVDGHYLGRFVAALSSLEKLTAFLYRNHSDVNGFVREIGRSRSRLSLLHLEVAEDEFVDVSPMLAVISCATSVTLRGKFDQYAIDSVADSCHQLSQFTVGTPFGITRPNSLLPTCAWKASF